MTRIAEFIQDIWNQLAEIGQLLVLVVVCAVVAVVVVDYTQTPTDDVTVGDIAPRTVKAPFTLTYKDFDAYEARRQDARDAVLSVYLHDGTTIDLLKTRVRSAFVAGRDEMARLEPAEDGEERELTPGDRTSLAAVFRGRLGVQLPQTEVDALIDGVFSREAEALANELLGHAMVHMVVRDRDDLDGRLHRVTVISLSAEDRQESVLNELDKVITPADARQLISIAQLESKTATPKEREAAATVARALVRPNFTAEALQTEERRTQAVAAVPMTARTVKRGAILFREGDPLTEADILEFQALQEHRGTHSVWSEIVAIGLFLFLLLGSLYHFGASYLHGFSTKRRDLIAVGAMLILTAVMARFVVAGSDGIAALVSYEAASSSVWFVVPVAGAAMIVRLLVGVGWTVVFSIAAASICGLVMDLQALVVVYYLLSSIAAAGAVDQTRERIAVLRAGVYTGLVNSAAVLLIHFLQMFVVDTELGLAGTIGPVWSMAFAFLGGVLSSFLVLGLVPMFEMLGFVTDYRLMELANLNHPLLRQLMLRAPGSYHHSVLVGTLAEAACEEIGANALEAKVASYFHDIGKSLKPQYFVENQRDGVNKHNALDPFTSAQVIINHVIDGGRMAREHKLPKPIIDNIYMHHGDGLLLYFFAKAQESGDEVDERAFRYPGPKPSTREAGVIMLADKVEAATRTIRVPNEESIRNMIHRIINSVMADGQFSECPLTFQEIHNIADTFVKVLLGIYHQRIEYPQTADVSRGDVTPTPADVRTTGNSRASLVTLEVVSTTKPPTEREDYESVEHLPRAKQ
jgi:cyclic-di-AMP phosphodiesterase PgpH